MRLLFRVGERKKAKSKDDKLLSPSLKVTSSSEMRDIFFTSFVIYRRTSQTAGKHEEE